MRQWEAAAFSQNLGIKSGIGFEWPMLLAIFNAGQQAQPETNLAVALRDERTPDE
jgi:hypothetical protein